MAVLRANKKNMHMMKMPMAGHWALVLRDAEQRKPADVDEALDAINSALEGNGIEAIRCERQIDHFYYDINLLYVNMGDPYRDTVMFDTHEGKFYVGGWGDWVKAMERKHGEGFCL